MGRYFRRRLPTVEVEQRLSLGREPGNVIHALE
jgi:hypothetical protein